MSGSYRRARRAAPKAKRAARSRQWQQKEREKTGLPVGTCPACGKISFTSRAGAKAGAEYRFPGQGLQVYECKDQPGAWHFTSQDAAVKELQRTVAAGARDGEAAARYVHHVVAGTGDGPTWDELGTAMGWPDGRARPLIIYALARSGWLATGAARRSLRPGPLFTPGPV